ncbi:MAG: SEC-C metal-binding domain-containing protein, partial [Bryocella sp.]
KKNRFDQDIADQLKEGKVNMLLWDRMSDVVDKSFEGEDWESQPFPTQDFPEEVLKLLGALNATRASGWLSAECHIRDLGDDGRKDLSKMLSDLRQTLNVHPARYFMLSGDSAPFFVWLQQHDHQIDWTKVNEKAIAAALAVKASKAIGIVAEVGSDGTYQSARSFAVRIPSARNEKNVYIYEDAVRMAQRAQVNLNGPKNVVRPATAKKLGRNDPCPCGSGVKYKRCHGR